MCGEPPVNYALDRCAWKRRPRRLVGLGDGGCGFDRSRQGYERCGNARRLWWRQFTYDFQLADGDLTRRPFTAPASQLAVTTRDCLFVNHFLLRRRHPGHHGQVISVAVSMKCCHSNRLCVLLLADTSQCWNLSQCNVTLINRKKTVQPFKCADPQIKDPDTAPTESQSARHHMIMTHDSWRADTIRPCLIPLRNSRLW